MNVERKLSYAECKKIVGAPDLIKEGKVTVSCLASVDIAFNVNRTREIVQAFEKGLEPDPKVSEYWDQVKKARASLSEKAQAKKIEELNRKYLTALSSHDKTMAEMERLSQTKKYDVELIGIDVEEFSGESEALPKVLDSLFPVLLREGEPLQPLSSDNSDGAAAQGKSRGKRVQRKG